MKASLSRRTFFLLPLVCAAIYGCPHDEAQSVEFADVIYMGKVTDEAMVALGSALDQAAPVEDPARAPVLDMPAVASLPATPIPTFQWHFGMAARLTPNSADVPFVTRFAHAEVPVWSGLSELFGPMKAAHAHGDPLVGPATLLVFSTAADPKLVRVFTDQTSYQPEQAVWDNLVAVKAEITLSLIGAEFDNNRIADGGSPVQGTKFVFTISQ